MDKKKMPEAIKGTTSDASLVWNLPEFKLLKYNLQMRGREVRFFLFYTLIHNRANVLQNQKMGNYMCQNWEQRL